MQQHEAAFESFMPQFDKAFTMLRAEMGHLQTQLEHTRWQANLWQQKYEHRNDLYNRLRRKHRRMLKR